jgi:hypothetical protein
LAAASSDEYEPMCKIAPACVIFIRHDDGPVFSTPRELKAVIELRKRLLLLRCDMLCARWTGSPVVARSVEGASPSNLSVVAYKVFLDARNALATCVQRLHAPLQHTQHAHT